jgi:hypothetical protein
VSLPLRFDLHGVWVRHPFRRTAGPAVPAGPVQRMSSAIATYWHVAAAQTQA